MVICNGGGFDGFRSALLAVKVWLKSYFSDIPSV